MFHLRARSILGLVIALSGFWLLVLFPALGAETIKSFSANIVLLENGSVDVTETITVNAEGVRIKRGIFRDIPTTLVNDDGSIIRSNLTIISIERDGVTEPYHTELIEDGLRVYVGEESVFLRFNTYTYTIRYTMTRMGRYFEDHDELYWNATGNFWAFPIESAVAQVTLPNGAIISDISVYTGAQGDTGSDAKARITADNVALFRATRSFAPREGMSVSVSFQKGILVEPSGVQKGINYLSDHRGAIFPLGAIFFVLLYFYFAWDAVGRDPEKGTIIPLFRAPEGYSPALVHFIDNMGWKKNGWTAYSAALISLATRGLVEIEKDEKKKVSFIHLGKPEGKLPRGEAVIEDYLADHKTFKINKTNGPALNKNRSKFINAIVSENRNAYFHNNILYSAAGVALSFLCILGLMASGILPPAQGIVLLAAGIGMGVLSAVIFASLSSGGFGKFIVFGWFGIVGINMAGNLGKLLTPLSIDTPLIATISIVLINIGFLFLMRAPTVHGRKIMDQIDGFKMYLKTAEENRLNFAGEPDFSVQRFEEILPYAIALGVEKPWANRLEGEFARHTIEQSGGPYQPHWYHGSGFNSGNLSKSVSGIASSMSSAMVSAQPSSSSSSGGGGGGFSGGGGGGGGGGGW